MIRWSIRLTATPMMIGGLVSVSGFFYAQVSVAPEADPIYRDFLDETTIASLEGLENEFERGDRRSQLSSDSASEMHFSNAVFVASNPLMAGESFGKLGRHSGRQSIPANRTMQRLASERYRLNGLRVQMHLEETAQYHRLTARTLASRAVRVGIDQPLRLLSQSLTRPQHRSFTLAELEQSSSFWGAAIHQLEQISSYSLESDAARHRLAEYQVQYQAHQMAIANHRNTLYANLVRSIVAAYDLEEDFVHITVCHLESNECRDLNGDRPPASPASLIKVPVAVALMQKIEEYQAEGHPIDLSMPLHLAFHNYTEDGSDLLVGREYSLEQVMARMINQSSNIATNQLIDFLGFDYINQVMGDRGYEGIFVGHKLVGEETFPAQFGHQGTNRITTNDLTQMMVEIYQQTYPGDDVLIDILATQTDHRMGQAALKGDKGEQIEWLGEKTGWNSKVLGTTLAVGVEGDRYIITVALDYTYGTLVMQSLIRDIADQLLEQNGF